MHGPVTCDIGESASFLAKSPYIRDLALLVIGYGMSINIVEVTWKSRLQAAFPEPARYSAFMGNFSSVTGAVTLLLMLVGEANPRLVLFVRTAVRSFLLTLHRNLRLLSFEVIYKLPLPARDPCLCLCP